jgi:peptide/nickel transport system substrate-binding protein
LKKQRLSYLFLVMSLLVVAVMVLSTACGTKSTTTTSAPGTTTAAPATTTTAPKTTTAAPATTTTAPKTTTAAPTSTAPAAKVPTGTLRWAITDFSYESTDPNYYESMWGWSMYDPFITYDVKGNYIGAVAESWTISPDGNTWTFKIRKDIKFHDGSPLTAEDVKFTLDRFSGDDPKYPSTNPWSNYISVKYNKVSATVIDPYTVQYVTVKPEPALVIAFSATRILPKAYFEKLGQDGFRKAPMGSGPWKFVSHVPKTSFTMEANTEYWNKARIPAFKTVIELMVPEEATQVNMLKNKEVDIINVTPDNIIALKKAGYKTQTFGLPGVSNINIQGSWLESSGPVHDVRIRQALSLALNREEIAKGYYNGLAVPGGRWFLTPGGYGWSDSWKPDPYDTAKAKQLMADANYPAGFADPTIHIYAAPGPSVDFINLLIGYWAAVGLKVKLELVDSTVWGGYFFSPATRMKEGDKNAGWIFVWMYGVVQNSTYHSANMYCSWGAHNTMNDPKADQMYKDATSELDIAKATAKWTAFEEYVHDQYISIGICINTPTTVVGPNVGAMTGQNWIGLENALDGIQHP